MLKRHSQLLISALMGLDMLVASLAWSAAFYLRFHTVFFRGIGNMHVPEPGSYFLMLLAIAPTTLVANHFCRLYEPRRIESFGREFIGILQAVIITVGIFLALAFFIRTVEARFSRTFIVLYAGLHTIFMTTERVAARRVLRNLRRRGKNIRRALIIGAGKNGQALARAIQRNAWTGVQVQGYLDDRPDRQDLIIRELPVLGATDRLLDIVRQQTIDQVYIALPVDEQKNALSLLDLLAEETVDIFLVPDVLSTASLNLDISNFEGMPLIHLRDTPVWGWNRFLKRTFDIGFSLAALALVGIPMCIMALVIKRSSKGPVFYSQERMGLDGRLFRMLKFRTMREDAEAQTGAVWASAADPRRTRVGALLRKTSLDELPQFLNVLAGQMSVVGPRPERPVFIEEFKKTVPRYMLRHKMKAGITGWAQVNGWRGNTSLKKRIQFDIYYIENWSLGFDCYIILLTVWRGFVNPHAY